MHVGCKCATVHQAGAESPVDECGTTCVDVESVNVVFDGVTVKAAAVLLLGAPLLLGWCI
jgi:hypothetical protein